MPKLKSLLILLALVLASPALAQSPVGLFVGARAGYGFAYGNFTANNVNLTGGDTTSYVFGGIVPFQAELGLRLPIGLEFGPYFQWSMGESNGPDCSGGVTCGSSDERIGLAISYHHKVWATNRSLWVGLTGGLEWARQSVSMTRLDAEAEYKGIDAALEGGFNYHYGPVEVGPFLAVSAGVYKQFSVTINGGQGTEDIREQDLHGWIILGIRGSVDLLGLH